MSDEVARRGQTTRGPRESMAAAAARAGKCGNAGAPSAGSEKVEEDRKPWRNSGMKVAAAVKMVDMNVDKLTTVPCSQKEKENTVRTRSSKRRYTREATGEEEMRRPATGGIPSRSAPSTDGGEGAHPDLGTQGEGRRPDLPTQKFQSAHGGGKLWQNFCLFPLCFFWAFFW